MAKRKGVAMRRDSNPAHVRAMMRQGDPGAALIEYFNTSLRLDLMRERLPAHVATILEAAGIRFASTSNDVCDALVLVAVNVGKNTFYPSLPVSGLGWASIEGPDAVRELVVDCVWIIWWHTATFAQDILRAMGVSAEEIEAGKGRHQAAEAGGGGDETT